MGISVKSSTLKAFFVALKLGNSRAGQDTEAFISRYFDEEPYCAARTIRSGGPVLFLPASNNLSVGVAG